MIKMMTRLFEDILNNNNNDTDPYVEKGNRQSGLEIYKRDVPGLLLRIQPRNYQKLESRSEYDKLKAEDADSVIVQTEIIDGKKVNHYFKVDFDYNSPDTYKNINEAAEHLDEVKKPFGESYANGSYPSRQKSLILGALVGAQLEGEENPLKKTVKKGSAPVRVAGGCKWRFVGNEKFQAIAAAVFFKKEFNLFKYWYAFNILNKKEYFLTEDELDDITKAYVDAQYTIKEMEKNENESLNKILEYASLYDKKPLNGILCEMPTFGEEISENEYNELVKTGDAIKNYKRYFKISWDKTNVKIFSCIRDAANDIINDKFELKDPTGRKVSIDKRENSISKNILWALIGREFVSGVATQEERYTAYYCKWSFPGTRNDRIRSAAKFFGDHYKVFFDQWCKTAIGLSTSKDINTTFLQAKVDLRQNDYIHSCSSSIEYSIRHGNDRISSFKSQIFSDDDLGDLLHRVEEIKKEMESLEGENDFNKWKKGHENYILNKIILKDNKDPNELGLGSLEKIYNKTKWRMRFKDTDEHDLYPKDKEAIETLLSGPQQRAACLDFIKWLSLDGELEELNKKIEHDTYMKKKIAQDEELLSQLDIQKNELNKMKNSILFDRILELTLE